LAFTWETDLSTLLKNGPFHFQKKQKLELQKSPDCEVVIRGGIGFYLLCWHLL